MSVRAWIQELFLRILNLESWIPENFAKFAKFLGFKIQDSQKKFLNPNSGFKIQDFEKKFLNPNLDSRLILGLVDVSEGLDSRTFFQNLESWIQNLDSRTFFRILNLESWIQNLDSRTFFFLNLESWIQKTLQSFWDSRFKIILGDSMCVCMCVYVSVYMVIGVLLYIYIYMLCYIYIWHPP